MTRLIGRAVAALGEGQKSECASGKARGGGRLGNRILRSSLALGVEASQQPY
jgi:hypothetical protein